MGHKGAGVDPEFGRWGCTLLKKLNTEKGSECYGG